MSTTCTATCMATSAWKRLAALVQEAFQRHRRTAYRIGGDEFCVLVRSVDEDRESPSALKEMTTKLEVLPRAGPAASVDFLRFSRPAAGAADASETLRAADRQMYAHKARRKAARAAGAPEGAGTDAIETLADEP